MIVIPTSDLVGILSDVIPFAHPDDEATSMHCVRLTWDGEQLNAITTDGYRIGWASWMPGDVNAGQELQDELFTDWASGDEPWTMMLALPDAKEIVKVFKLGPKPGAVAPLFLDYDEERRRLKVERARESGHSAITYAAVDEFVEFPDVQRQLQEADMLTDVRSVVYHAPGLADFAKVRPRGPLVLVFAEGITHVSIGERFIGAIIPVRD